MVDAAGPGGDAGESVVVVTHVRPLVDSEIEEGAAECLTVTGSAAEVSSGARVLEAATAPAPRHAAPHRAACPTAAPPAAAALAAARARALISPPISNFPPPPLARPPSPRAQVGHGAHRFTYDRVFGGDAGDDPAALYGLCVAPLVDGLFKGYNATVFAYGQARGGRCT
jgi:hypothetical protein